MSVKCDVAIEIVENWKETDCVSLLVIPRIPVNISSYKSSLFPKAIKMEGETILFLIQYDWNPMPNMYPPQGV